MDWKSFKKNEFKINKLFAANMFRWWSIQNSNLKVSDDLLTSLVTIKDKWDNDKVSLKEHHFLENSND